MTPATPREIAMQIVFLNILQESRLIDTSKLVGKPKDIIMDAMKIAYNAAVRKCAEEPNLASIGQLTPKEIILKNLIA